MILPHPDVTGYMIFEAFYYKKWLGAMRKLRAKIIANLGRNKVAEMHKFIQFLA